ncbi:hypothetical protein AB0L49_02350 [Streptomyces antimycoticus]|uniref:hypothetical protein n=1 Tax=Streptomyces antimycoticus TaxID=68175 RepID=UPI00343C4108
MSVYSLVYLHVYRSSTAVYLAVYHPIYPPRGREMTKEEAVREAAREVIEHGGPACLTDPREVMRAVGRALDAGASNEDIKAEMRRQRNA